MIFRSVIFPFSSVCLPLAISLCLHGVGSADDAREEAQGRSLPVSWTLAQPLLAAPINATWAANDAEAWAQKGFRGFIFEGILDDFSPFPSEGEGAEGKSVFSASDAGTIVPGDWESLIQEITGAHRRLSAAGVSRNFLRLNLAPEEAYITDPGLAELAVNRMELAGAFARRTGLAGIALNTDMSSPIFDYRWDGYPVGLEEESLRDQARILGRRMFARSANASPKMDILLVANRLEAASPLWYAFVEGAYEALSAADTIRLLMVFLEDAATDHPRSAYARRKQLDRAFRLRFSPANYRAWKSRGGLVPVLEPIGYQGDIPVARYPLRDYRRRLYEAALKGDAYVCILAPEGGWWHTPPDLVDQFQHLKQRGRAKVRFTPPVPAPLDAYAPRLPFHDCVYVGDIPFQGNEAAVLRCGTAAMLVAWEGLNAPMNIPLRTGMVKVTDVCSEEERYFTPREEMIQAPVQPGTLLIEGLPLAEYLLPASLKMELEDPLTAGVSRSPLFVTASNPMDIGLSGTLTLWTDSRYALGSAVFQLRLAPGQALSFKRTVQGLSSLGSRPIFSISLAAPGGSPIQRDFCFPVQPRRKALLITDGPHAGMPVIVPPSGGSKRLPDLLYCTVRGELGTYSLQTTSQISRARLRGSFDLPPVLLVDKAGNRLFALVNRHGRLRFFSEHLEEKVLILLDGQPLDIVGSGPPGSGVAVALAGKGIFSYDASGRLGRQLDEPFVEVRFAQGSPYPHSLVFAASKSADEHGLYAVDSQGIEVMLASIPARATARPVVHGTPDGNVSSVFLADALGNLYRCRLGGTGEAERLEWSGDTQPVSLMAVSVDIRGDSCRLFASDGETLFSFCVPNGDSDADGYAWAHRAPGITALALLPNGGGVAIGLSTGGVYAYDAQGNLMWEEHEDGAAITSLTVVAHPVESQGYWCLAAAADGEMRLLAIRPGDAASSFRPVLP